MSVIFKWSMAVAIGLVVAIVTPPAARAQTFATVYDFCYETRCTDGVQPNGGLTQGTHGYLYGTTAGGLLPTGYFPGTVFRMAPDGTLTTLYTFCSDAYCKDGNGPGRLVLGNDGDLYGTTSGGGAVGNDSGTIFKITPSGTLTTLYSFCAQTNCPDGRSPSAPLVVATDGNFYGTTPEDGANTKNGADYGTVFKMTPAGKLTTLHSFCSEANCADGRQPASGLVQASNGNLYGTTVAGGSMYAGTVYKITPSGVLTTLYTFCSQPGCSDGLLPWAGLIEATDGNLYGTTLGGGTKENGIVFKITPGGALTTLYNFCSESECADGAGPYARLVQGSDGNLYGTTSSGGTGGFGTIFKLTLNGSLTTLHSFCNEAACPNVGNSAVGLMQDTSGVFYGTSFQGGYETVCNYGGCGTVFSLATGLAPFLKMRPSFGNVGVTVDILGTGFTGATQVTFNGTAASFTVVSPSVITATVPAGATTGDVAVVTPGGTLTSNVLFTVTP